MAAGRRIILNPNPYKLSILIIRCRLQDQNVDALYSPAVGANLMLDEFALAFLGNYKLTPTDRQLKRPSGSLTSSYGIITDVPFLVQ